MALWFSADNILALDAAQPRHSLSSGIITSAPVQKQHTEQAVDSSSSGIAADMPPPPSWRQQAAPHTQQQQQQCQVPDALNGASQAASAASASTTHIPPASSATAATTTSSTGGEVSAEHDAPNAPVASMAAPMAASMPSGRSSPSSPQRYVYRFPLLWRGDWLRFSNTYSAAVMRLFMDERVPPHRRATPQEHGFVFIERLHEACDPGAPEAAAAAAAAINGA